MAKKSEFNLLESDLCEKLSFIGIHQTFSPGAVLLQSGARPDGVWVIEDGIIEGIAQDPDARAPQVVEEFGVGEMVGWLGVIQNNWVESLRAKTYVSAFLVEREVFLTAWREELRLRQWCRKQTPAIELIHALQRLSAHSTQRRFQLAEWQHHYIINQIAQKEIKYCSKDLVDIPGGNWHFIDGSLCPLLDKGLLNDETRVVFLSSVKEDLPQLASTRLSRSALAMRKNQVQDEKTVIIFGNARGGTTMIAKILATMGVDVGTTSQEAISLEDKMFRYDLYNDEDHDDITMQLKAAIAKNNMSKGLWGWKYPMARLYLEDVIDAVRNPHLICVYRDVFACAMRQVKDALDNEAQGLNPEHCIAEESRQCLANVEMIERLALPALMCSYEKIISHPNDFIEMASNFLDLSLDENVKHRCLDDIHPGSYGSPVSS